MKKLSKLCAGILALLLLLSGCAYNASAGGEAQDHDGSLSAGEYTVEAELKGGSGRAHITSPALLKVNDEGMEICLEFSSPHYDYVYIPPEGEHISPVNTEGNSSFIVPVSTLDEPLKLTADTTAMSEPHEIEYEVVFKPETLRSKVDINQTNPSNDSKSTNSSSDKVDINPTALSGTSCEYARYFDIEKVSDGVSRITVAGGEKYLLVDEGAEYSKEEGAEVLQKPLRELYLAASAPVDYFRELGRLDMVRMTSTKEENWNLPAVKEALEKGDMTYIGKYSSPDFETLISRGCSLCVESTMIFHQPEIKDKIGELGIPLLIDYSSYEDHPLGRLEWIKLYGALMGEEEAADELFDREVKRINALPERESAKSVAFFYVTSDGRVNARRDGDYIVNMIKMAGGDYAFKGIAPDEGGSQTAINMTFEEFYVRAKDADVLIYNSAIDEPVRSYEELFEKSSLFKDFKAVKNDEVWGTTKSMYQEVTGIGVMIEELSLAIADDRSRENELKYLYRVR